MKKYIYIVVACIATMLTACSTDAVSDLNGTYSNIQRYNYTQASVLPTTKLKKGVKSLNINFTDVSNQTAVISFACAEWVLQQNTYVAKTTAALDKECSGTINGKQIVEGSFDVSTLENATDTTYFINGMVKLADGTESIVNYSGVLNFIVGVDDPEASGYTFTITEQPVSIMDYTTFTPTVYTEVTKYIISVNNPNGNKVAEFNAINANSMVASALTGSYAVESNAHEAMLVDAGYAYPEYNIFGGTFYTDANGNMQYITAGNINIETAIDGEGQLLFTFSGTGIASTDTNGTSVTAGTFKIPFATLNNQE